MVREIPNAEGAQQDGLAVGQGVTWAQVVKGLKYDSRKSAMSQPQHLDVKPVEVVGEGSDEDLVQGQVVQGPMGRGDCVEGPVSVRLVRGPIDGDVLDAKRLQPEKVFTDPGPTINRSTKVSKVPNKYKDVVKE